VLIREKVEGVGVSKNFGCASSGHLSFCGAAHPPKMVAMAVRKNNFGDISRA
jgi:hypothetical protein